MKTYEYRVIAVNAAGPSKPSDSTGSIQARPMEEAPKYVLEVCRKIAISCYIRRYAIFSNDYLIIV